MSEPRAASWAARAKAFLLGKARDIRDPSLFHNLSLVAFSAWVGLGADGLSSSCSATSFAVQRRLHQREFLSSSWR